MSRRVDDIVLRRELLTTRCALERLEARAALLELRAVSPLREARRMLAGTPLRSRLFEIAVIAIGSTRLRRAARWLARGVLVWKIWGVVSALRGRASDAGSAASDATARRAPPLPSARPGAAAPAGTSA